jgi:hypothetical protein
MENTVAELGILASTERPPGFLLEPFKWAIPKLLVMLQNQPEYLIDLVHLTRTRMHLVGLALAHLEGMPSSELSDVLFRGSAETILQTAVGQRPTGLKRAVSVMPNYMLKQESYRELVTLLTEPDAARLIYHSFEIHDATIRAMSDIPAALRGVAFSLHENADVDMSSFSKGLRCIAMRSGKLSFEDLVSELANACQPGQFFAKLKSIVESLPLPDALPPARVHRAERIDSGSQLRALAKEWGNCLGSYVWNVDNGQCAVYVWRDGDLQAACHVTRCGRLGWFLEDTKGPENSDLERRDLDTIFGAFESARIPPVSDITSIAQLVAHENVPWRERRPHRRVRSLPLPEEIPSLDPT